MVVTLGINVSFAVASPVAHDVKKDHAFYHHVLKTVRIS